MSNTNLDNKRPPCEDYNTYAYSIDCDGKGEIGLGEHREGICSTYLDKLKSKNCKKYAEVILNETNSY